MVGQRLKLIWYLVYVFCFLQYTTSHDQPQENADKIKNGRMEGNCIVRDGRDGLPGQPGLPGRPGNPGRNGRNCYMSLLLTRVFELEKQLVQLSMEFQKIKNEGKKMKEDVATCRHQTQKLFEILAAKQTVDEDVLREAARLRPPINQKATETAEPTKKTTTDTSSSNKKTEQTKPAEKIITYSAIVIPISAQRPTLRVPTETITNPTDPSPGVESTKKVCAKRFHVDQEVNTKGAVDANVFEIANVTYLAVANYHLKNDQGYNTKSSIYRMNPETDRFEMFQELPTTGCHALVSFNTEKASFLFTANHYNGVTYDLNSVIFKWNGTRFQSFRELQTSGASAAQFFTIANENYLVIANFRNETTVSVSSVIYKWRQGRLEVLQNIQTHGGVDCKFYQTSTSGLFLGFANYYTSSSGFNVESEVFKWNGQRFVPLQAILTSAAISIDIFEDNNSLQVFLAIASHRTVESWHSHTKVFLWNGTSFVTFQNIPTTAAAKVRHFYDEEGALFLTIANYYDEITNFEAHSMVYKYDGSRFVKFQGILTTGAYALQPFSYKGVPYLASAFRYNGTHSNLRSKIYKMTASCETSYDGLLP